MLLFALWPATDRPPSGPRGCEEAGSREPARLKFCWDQFEGLSEPSAVELKKQLAYKSPSANDKFIDEAVLADPPAGAVFFHVDNVMMKQLNDVIFKDKGLSAATESLWTKIFFETLQGDVEKGVEGAEMPWVAYSDYKTIRIGFKKSGAALEKWLETVYKRASRRFSRELGDYEYVDGLIRAQGEEAAQPVKWHIAGFGATPGQAAAAARAGRYHGAGPPGATRPIEDARNEALQKTLAANLSSLEEIRRRVQTDAVALFGHDVPFLEAVPGMKDTYVLSRDVLDIFKRLDGIEGEQFLEEATAALRRRFERRFRGTDDIDWAKLVSNMHAYYKAVDPFMPPIYERQEVLDLGYGDAKHGIVSFDLVGANKDNVVTFMGEMAKTSAAVRQARAEGHAMTPRQVIELAIGNAKKGQQGASDRFLARRKRFVDAVDKLGVPGRKVLSGDEVLFYPDRPLTAEERGKLAALLAKDAPPDDGRLGFLPPTYHGRADEIPPARRAAFLNFAEAVEKNVRIDLEITGAIPRSRLVKIGIAVDLEANDNRAGTVGLVLTGTVSDRDKAVIERAVKEMLPDGFRYGTTRTPHAP